MKISKRKIKELKSVSVSHNILQYYGYSFVDRHPDEWDKTEKMIYDMVNDIENKMIVEILKTLNASEVEQTLEKK